VGLLDRHSFITVGRTTLLRFHLKNFGDPRFVELPLTQINFGFAGSWWQFQRPVSANQLLVSRYTYMFVIYSCLVHSLECTYFICALVTENDMRNKEP